MKQIGALHITRDKVIGFAVVFTLHFLALCGLWSYQAIPPPSEALTVFVSYINPSAPARPAEPVTKPTIQEPVRRDVSKKVPPLAPSLMASTTPVKSSVEQVVPLPPVVKTQPAQESTNSTVVSTPVQLAAVATGPQPLHLNGELAVSCSDRTAPIYPKQSLRLGEQGKTVLLVELDELGRVVNVSVKTKSGFPRLDEAAITAVKTWRCNPAKKNGVTVHSIALQPFNFILKGR